MQLQFPFPYISPTDNIRHDFKTVENIDTLFDGVITMEDFIASLELHSRSHSKIKKLLSSGNDRLINKGQTKRLQYVGDGFEFFVELLFAHFPNHRMLGGISSYTPILRGDGDYGADGLAENFHNKKSVIQVKYRSNENNNLTANRDHLSNLITAATFHYGITPHNKDTETSRYFVVTSAKGLHYFTDSEMYAGYVQCIGIDTLRYLVDNNLDFWNSVRGTIKNLVS